MNNRDAEHEMYLKMKEYVDKLANQILVARDEYYNGTPSMSDDEYDALESELRKLDADHQVLKRVGAEPASAWEKHQHVIPMGSLDKAQNEQEFVKWANKLDPKTTYSITDKLDGISIEVEYLKGSFQVASTRGNGYQGEDISQNVLKMKGVRRILPEPFTGSLRGEIVLLKEDWLRHMPDMKNPRNGCSGTAKRLDGSGCQHLTVIFYEVIGDVKLPTHVDQLCFLKTLGLQVPNYGFCKGADVPKWVEDRLKERDKIPYEIDGLVVRIDNQETFDSLGDLDMRPRGAIAYKPPPETKVTTVKNIVWQVGRIGRVCPVAELEAVDIGGVTISRVSLHTAKMAVELKAGPGSKVLVSRRNDVIPYVEEVLTPVKVEVPRGCPVCSELLDWDGEYLQCNNGLCPSVLHSAVKVWTERLDVLHWGDALIDQLIDGEYVKTLPDIYKIKWDRFSVEHGGGIATRAMVSLKEHERMSMVQFITALNIRQCQTTSRDIVSAGYDTADKFLALDSTTLAAIPGIGPVKAKFISRGIKQLEPVIRELVKHVTIKEPKMGKLNGQSVCFTGKSSHSRKELSEMAEAAGLEVKNSVGAGLTMLVMADSNSTSSKAEKARKLGTKCVSENEFVKMVS